MVQWFPVQKHIVNKHVPCRILTREQFVFEVFIMMPKISPYDNYKYMFFNYTKYV